MHKIDISKRALKFMAKQPKPQQEIADRYTRDIKIVRVDTAMVVSALFLTNR